MEIEMGSVWYGMVVRCIWEWDMDRTLEFRDGLSVILGEGGSGGVGSGGVGVDVAAHCCCISVEKSLEKAKRKAKQNSI